MWNKIFVAFTIFTLLFSGAFVLNKKERLDFYEPEAEEDIVEIVPLEMEKEAIKKRPMKIFKSREYVRIEHTAYDISTP